MEFNSLGPETVSETDCPAVHFHEAESSVGEKRPRGSRERAPVYVQCEPKENDEVAHQVLPSNFVISFEARPSGRETKANGSLRKKLSPNYDRLGARLKKDLRQATKSFTLPFFSGRTLHATVASLAGKEAMPCSAFAGQETWCARTVHTDVCYLGVTPPR